MTGRSTACSDTVSGRTRARGVLTSAAAAGVAPRCCSDDTGAHLDTATGIHQNPASSWCGVLPMYGGSSASPLHGDEGDEETERMLKRSSERALLEVSSMGALT